MKAGPLIGNFSRNKYDDCYYPDYMKESTDPVSYRINPNYIHNCDRCLDSNGSSPRSTTMGFGVSTVRDVSIAPFNDLVDVDSVCKNLNVKTSKCKRGKINPVNLTEHKFYDNAVCGKNIEHSRLTYPSSNYRDMSVNRFYNLPLDPQANIFWDNRHNTRLEAKDNWKPKIPTPWKDMTSVKEIMGNNTQTCKNWL